MMFDNFVVSLLMLLLVSSHKNVESLSFKKEWIKQLVPSSLSYFPISYPKMNSSHLRTAMFSCLEEKRYDSVANYVNCHIFCPSCHQGFGRCVDSPEGLKLCLCDCQYPVQLHKECPSVRKYCKTELLYDIGKLRNSDVLLTQCKKACVSLGFSDGALCGLDEESAIVKSTCTCLCPKLSLD